MSKMRILFLTLATFVVSVGVIMNAYSKKHQFYPTVVYLTNSSRSMSILYIQAFLVVWQIVKVLKFIFFGNLRAIEIEHLIEKSWFAILDTFILLAAFHEELNPKFVGLVLLLFVMKSFHWLASDRVDYMEQSPVITWKFHARAVSLLLLLGAVDVLFVKKAWSSLKTRGLSVDIVFGLEYAIMLTEAINIFLKYILHTIDLRNENPWENKPIYIRYVDIVLGVIELLLYSGYMAFMLMVPFIPLHIARRVYRTARDFHKSVHDVISSHQAIRNLNTLYPDATPQELETANNVCIICREEMIERCKKLPCNHIFHTSCLRSWFQRQHTCPTCRMDVLRNTALRGRPGQPAQPPNQMRQRQDEEQRPPGGPQMMFPPQMMGGWGPGPMVPPPQQEPHPPPAEQQPNAAPPTATPPGPQTGPVPPSTQPSFPPSFFPMMYPFYPPPPPPIFSPQNDDFLQSVLQGLTEEQLRDLEGMERANVEARIVLLRNVQQLLDMAVSQLNQYSAVMASMNIPAGPGFPGFPPPPPVSMDTTPSQDETTQYVDPAASSSTPVIDPSVGGASGFDVQTLSPQVSHDVENSEPEHEESQSNKKQSVDIPDSELIRQRRLQRFHSLPVSASLSPLDTLPETSLKQNDDESDDDTSNKDTINVS